MKGEELLGSCIENEAQEMCTAVADAAASAFKNLVPDTATPLPDLQDTSQEAVQLVPPEFTGKVWDYIEDQVLAQSQGGDRCRRVADRHPRGPRPGARGLLCHRG